MRVRRAHKLKSNKRTFIPTQFVFFDTETREVKKSSRTSVHKLKLGWACYWRRSSEFETDIEKWKYFETQTEFWDFIEQSVRSKTRLVLIAHNVVFDFTIVGGWIQLINRGWKLDRLYEKGHVFIARYKKSSKTILILDNMNYFAVPLWKLGAQIGYEKLDIDFTKCTNEELSIYCKRDVEILLKTWQQYFRWFKENDLGNFGVTISAQSFNTYRHRFMKHDIYIHNRLYALNLERDAYFGGRTECFKLGSFIKDKFYYLDINSMYPAVMKDNEFPIKFFAHKVKPSEEFLRLCLKKYCVVARVKIKTKKPIVPYRKDVKVLFPIGRFETVLTTPELKLALEENVIQKVLSMCLYEKAQIFKDFIDFFYNERLKAKQQGNTAYDLFFKLIMNSLYGKFGQLMGEWTTVGKCDPREVEYWREVAQGDGRVYKYRKINGLIQRYEKRSEAFNSFPAVSAHVTAYARVKLWRLIEKAGMKNVYYCDTDSIFVNEEGYQNLKSEIDNKELGMLKVESVTSDLKILGCKQYVFGKKKRHKGKKKNAKKIDDKTFEQEQWATLKTLIQNKNLVDYQVNRIVKHFSGVYDKGVVQPDGTVKPLIL